MHDDRYRRFLQKPCGSNLCPTGAHPPRHSQRTHRHYPVVTGPPAQSGGRQRTVLLRGNHHLQGLFHPLGNHDLRFGEREVGGGYLYRHHLEQAIRARGLDEPLTLAHRQHPTIIGNPHNIGLVGPPCEPHRRGRTAVVRKELRCDLTRLSGKQKDVWRLELEHRGSTRTWRGRRNHRSSVAHHLHRRGTEPVSNPCLYLRNAGLHPHQGGNPRLRRVKLHAYHVGVAAPPLYPGGHHWLAAPVIRGCQDALTLVQGDGNSRRRNDYLGHLGGGRPQRERNQRCRYNNCRSRCNSHACAFPDVMGLTREITSRYERQPSPRHTTVSSRNPARCPCVRPSEARFIFYRCIAHVWRDTDMYTELDYTGIGGPGMWDPMPVPPPVRPPQPEEPAIWSETPAAPAASQPAAPARSAAAPARKKKTVKKKAVRKKAAKKTAKKKVAKKKKPARKKAVRKSAKKKRPARKAARRKPARTSRKKAKKAARKKKR